MELALTPSGRIVLRTTPDSQGAEPEWQPGEVDHQELIEADAEKAVAAATSRGKSKRLAADELGDIFGIEIDTGNTDTSSSKKPSRRKPSSKKQGKAVAKKVPAKNKSSKAKGKKSAKASRKKPSPKASLSSTEDGSHSGKGSNVKKPAAPRKKT